MYVSHSLADGPVYRRNRRMRHGHVHRRAGGYVNQDYGKVNSARRPCGQGRHGHSAFAPGGFLALLY